MVQTTYPVMWKYVNKWSMLAYGLIFLCNMNGMVFLGHLTWKRGKVPRLAYNDQKYTKALNNRGLRDKILLEPALNNYPGTESYTQLKALKPFFKKHRRL